MNWKWAIDRRSGTVRIDKRALGASIAGGVTLVVATRTLLPENWYYAVTAMLVIAGIGFDVWIRRREEGPSSSETFESAEGSTDDSCD